MEHAPGPPKPLTVSELTRALKLTIKRHFDEVYVEGEVASFTPHRSGHWYFLLKDQRATINTVMFRGVNQKMEWRPKIGDKVVVKGKLDIYPPHGKYNLQAHRMMRAGLGAHQQKVEALKRKLQAEGAMDPARKRRLPFVPRAIGVATSASGAAFHDIRKVIDRRFPNVTLYLAPCRVQGNGAAQEIVAAIRLLNHHGRSDVLISAAAAEAAKTSRPSTRSPWPEPSWPRRSQSSAPSAMRSTPASPTSSPTSARRPRATRPSWSSQSGPSWSTGSRASKSACSGQHAVTSSAGASSSAASASQTPVTASPRPASASTSCQTDSTRESAGTSRAVASSS
jgi:hypothetical protein